MIARQIKNEHVESFIFHLTHSLMTQKVRCYDQLGEHLKKIGVL